jgi:hypothetical protein
LILKAAQRLMFCSQLTVFLLALAAFGATQARQALLPVDEAAQQPDFFSFRAQLLVALARRDVDAVLAVVDPRIRNSFGDDGGTAEFVARWALETPDSKLWQELTAALALGGRFNSGGDQFTAPYTFSHWPDAVDAFEHVAIVGQDVRVRARADSASAVIGAFSHEVVPLAQPLGDNHLPAPGPGVGIAKATAAWAAVRLADGQVGFVARQFTRSPIDYRAIFQRTGGRWRLVTFVAGD